jgi:hypothetical protein
MRRLETVHVLDDVRGSGVLAVGIVAERLERGG